MPGQHALQLDEPARTGGEVTDDEQRPLVADEVERACVGRPLVVGVTFGRWDRWYERPPWCGLGCGENTGPTAEGCWYRHTRPMTRTCITSASSRRLARCMAATGRNCSRVWRNDTRSRMYGMGEVIDWHERRARRRAGGGMARRASGREFFFDLASPVHVPGGRAGRARVRRGDAGRRRARARCAAPRCPRRRRRRSRRDAAEERAAALRLPLVWPERCPTPVPAAMRVAALRGRAGPRRARSCSPPRGSRSAAASTSTTSRS